MHLTFLARVAYASDRLGALTSTQFADSKPTHTEISLLSSAKTSIKFPAYLTGFPENNEKKQGEHNETDSALEIELIRYETLVKACCDSISVLQMQFRRLWRRGSQPRFRYISTMSDLTVVGLDSL
jgi:hypothetical protein